MNVLCKDNDTAIFKWQTPRSIIFLANVHHVAFSGNAVQMGAGCANPSGNYAMPVSMVNAINIKGLSRQA